MSQSPDEARFARLEARVEAAATASAAAAADAAAARYLAAAHDRDIADLGVGVKACRTAINALGEQTRERLDRLEEKVDTGFTELRGEISELRGGLFELRNATRHGFDQTAAGFARIAGLIEGLEARGAGE